MELTICSSCGSVIKGVAKNCASCGSFVPVYPSAPINNTALAIKPLRAEIQAKATTLDRIAVTHPAYGVRAALSTNGNELINRLKINGDPLNGEIGQQKFDPPVATPVSMDEITAAAQIAPASPAQADFDSYQTASLDQEPFKPNAINAPAVAQNSPGDDFFAATSNAAIQPKHLEQETESSTPNSAHKHIDSSSSPEFAFSSTEHSEPWKEGAKLALGQSSTDSPAVEDKQTSLAFLPETDKKVLHKHSSEDDKEEDDDEEAEPDDEDYIAPKRRSFSGSPAKTTTITQSKLRNISSKADIDDEEEPLKPNNTDALTLFGITVPKKAILIVACLLGFIMFWIFAANMLSNIIGSQSPKSEAISLSGKWRFAAQCGNAKCAGEMLFHQHGSQINGDGVDNAGGPFKFAGSIKDNQHIELAKRYVRNGQLAGDVTSFHGEIQNENNSPFISGDFRRDTMQGGKWRGRPMTYTGIWEAEMTQPMAEDSNGSSAGGLEGNFTKPVGAASLTQSFATGAIGLLVVAVFGLYAMRVLFGPDGLRATWDKEKYIPSQFRGQNKKDIQELSQGLVPGSLPLGQREEWKFWNAFTPWVAKQIALPPALRKKNPHLLILGGGKKGKSRLMATMITHDIESNDRAIVLIDSDGGLADTVTRWISAHPKSKSLAKRVVMIDPSYPGGTNTYNPLAMPEDGNLQSAASSLVFGMKAIYTEAPNSQNAWSAQTADILANAALLLMVSGKTLTDLSTLLTDNDKRDEWLEAVEKKKKEKVEYQGIVDAWNRYKRVARSEQWLNWIEPILNRVSPTLSDPRVRPILTKQEGGINLCDVITGKKILIVKIPKAQLHDHANLLGSLIVTGVKQAALTIANKDSTQQRAVALYLDEFDNFIEKETFDAITHETKKFQVGFIGAIKTLQHLPEDFRNQLIINVGTISVFALAKKDGDMLGPQMFRVDGRKKKHETLTNFINPINSSPQFELISDEEKFNIDRILGQAERTFFCYRVGTVAGLFHLKSHSFNDIPDSATDEKLIAKMHIIKA